MSQQPWLRWSVPALLLVTLLTAGCSPTSPSPTSYCASHGSLSAQIDRVAWSADCVAATNSVDLRYIEINGNTRDGTQWLTFVSTLPSLAHIKLADQSRQLWGWPQVRA